MPHSNPEQTDIQRIAIIAEAARRDARRGKTAREYEDIQRTEIEQLIQCAENTIDTTRESLTLRSNALDS